MNIQKPTIDVQNMRLTGMSFEALNLAFGMKIANTFSLLLNKLDYNFAVNGKTWVKGLSDKQTQVTEKDEDTIAIPISLNFVEMGSSIP